MAPCGAAGEVFGAQGRRSLTAVAQIEKGESLTDTSKSEPGASVLAALARHERELITKMSEGEREAERIVEAARAEAQALLEEAEKAVAAEVDRVRREGALARERDRQAQAEESEAQLARMREEAAGRAREIIQEVVTLILPAYARASARRINGRGSS